MTTPHLKKSIGSSPSRLAPLLIALVFACLGIQQSAQAGYIVTLQQVGPDVVATGSGAIDLHGLTFSNSTFLVPEILPSFHSLGHYMGMGCEIVRGRFLPCTGSTTERRPLPRGQWTDQFRKDILL